MIFGVAATAFALAVVSPAVSPRACDPRRAFERVRAAVGGRHWNGVAEVVADGTIADAGDSASLHVARDLDSGRYRFTESGNQGGVTYIFDGRMEWERDESLGVHSLDAPASLAQAVTTAYLGRNGYWSEHAAARLACLPETVDGERRFDVYRITPRNGSPVNVWIDSQTHRIERTVRMFSTTPSTESYSDYRSTGGVVLPFRITRQYLDAFGRPALSVETIKSYRLLHVARDADFARPPNPAAAKIANGGGEARVPFRLDNGVIVFEARINGRGPFAFTFDPGAQGVLTSAAAFPLHLRLGIMAHVRQLQVGDAQIDDLSLPVYQGNPSDIFSGSTTQRAPIAGSLGPELLDRFAVRIDYARRMMTLLSFSGFHCGSAGVAQPFRLQEDDDIPLLPAIIDGHRGILAYDVRAPSSLLLFAPFLQATGLAASERTKKGTIEDLTFGGATMHGISARFLRSSGGKFASNSEAGLVGSALLARFVTTLDYRRRTICFER